MVGLLVFVAQPVWAAPLTLGDFTGTTVEFLNVVSDDGVQIGPATLNGDALEFSPRFSSGAAGGSSNSTVATLTFGLAALPGFAIDSFAAQESGVISLTGVGTGATSAMAALLIQLIIDEVDGSPIAPVTQNLTVSLAYNLLASPGESPWSMGVSGNLPGILNLNSVPFTFGATHVFVSFTNTLTTTSQQGSAAGISKEAFSVSAQTIPTTAVPEPSTLCLVGLGVMAAYRRLRRA